MGKVHEQRGGRDARDVAHHRVAEAARCLVLPASTVRGWAVGVPYRTARGDTRRMKPLLHPHRSATDPSGIWSRSTFASTGLVLERHIRHARAVARSAPGEVRDGSSRGSALKPGGTPDRAWRPPPGSAAQRSSKRDRLRRRGRTAPSGGRLRPERVRDDNPPREGQPNHHPESVGERLRRDGRVGDHEPAERAGEIQLHDAGCAGLLEPGVRRGAHRRRQRPIDARPG